MRLPYMNDVPRSTETINVFKGYNHNARIADGEWYDMENMSSRAYPLLTPREPRWIEKIPGIQTGETIQAIFPYKDSYGYVCRQGEQCEIRIPDGDSMKAGVLDLFDERQVVTMGGKIIIFPDKKYLEMTEIQNKAALVFHPIDSIFLYVGEYSIKNCDADGNAYSDSDLPTTEPNDPEPGDLWLDGNTIKRWTYTQQWETVVTSYVLFEALETRLHQYFTKGDGVQISIDRFEKPQNVVAGIGTIDEQESFSANWVVEKTVQDGIVIRGILGTNTIAGSSEIMIERRMPLLDFVIESGNRLWGCRYGNSMGKFVNEIYASKLGDPTNWRVYQGISTDSYAVSIGSDGPFTGAVNYRGVPTFFKENCLIEIQGSYPAQYRVQSAVCRGVERNSAKSLAVANNVLYYKTTGGVCRYDGSLPEDVGEMLGQSYHNAVAGALNDRYYLAMNSVSDDEFRDIFVLDTSRGLWHREDKSYVREFFPITSALLMVDGSGDNVYRIPADSDRSALQGENEPPFNWMVESGEIGLQIPDAKYISRISLRLQMSKDSEASFFVQYDSDGEWHFATTITATRLKTVDLPIRVSRCDHMKLKIEGIGEAKIYSITKIIEKGNDL